jgi:hypothetical protein
MQKQFHVTIDFRFLALATDDAHYIVLVVFLSVGIDQKYKILSIHFFKIVTKVSLFTHQTLNRVVCHSPIVSNITSSNPSGRKAFWASCKRFGFNFLDEFRYHTFTLGFPFPSILLCIIQVFMTCDSKHPTIM